MREKIVKAFRLLAYSDKILLLRDLLTDARVCPRCLRDFRYEEEIKANICKQCALSFIEALDSTRKL